MKFGLSIPTLTGFPRDSEPPDILILPTHHPIDIAERVAMVDEISDGRVMLGVAIGDRPYELEQLGLVFKERVGA